MVELATRARNAKIRAAEEFAKGNLSPDEKARIDRKSDDILAPQGASS